MNAAVISKIIKVVAALLALYGVETTPDQVQAITEAVLVGYAILSAIEARVKAKGAQ